MYRSNVPKLLTLAALQGGSFLLMRVAASPLGPIALITLWMVVALCFLIPTLALYGGMDALRTHWPHLLAVGMLNSTISFCLFAYAELTLTTGFTSIPNATTPLFVAIAALTQLDGRTSSLRALGLAIGFVSAIMLVGGSSVIDTKQGGVTMATALSAAVPYDVTSSYAKRFLTDVPPLAIATDSQVTAAIMLAPLTYQLWSAQAPTDGVRLRVTTLSIVYTGVTYILLFCLVAHVGPTRVVSAAFLILVSGVLQGTLFLGEQLALDTMVDRAVILPGALLSAGVFTPDRKTTTNGIVPASDRGSLLHSGRRMANECTGCPGHSSLLKIYSEPTLNCSAKFIGNAAISSLPHAHCDGLNSATYNEYHTTTIALKFTQQPGH